jgi:hypothetical protein
MRKTYSFAALAGILLVIFVMLSSGDIKSRYDGGGRDMVEELYYQAVKQNESLEAIEDDIEKFYKKKQEALEKYSSYSSYNSRYYYDAKANVAGITDAATRQKATDILTVSETRYKTSVAEWERNITSLQVKEKELNDLHSLLKIMFSEKMINRYQSGNFPDGSKLNEANNELQSVIEKIKAITR